MFFSLDRPYFLWEEISMHNGASRTTAYYPIEIELIIQNAFEDIWRNIPDDGEAVISILNELNQLPAIGFDGIDDFLQFNTLRDLVIFKEEQSGNEGSIAFKTEALEEMYNILPRSAEFKDGLIELAAMHQKSANSLQLDTLNKMIFLADQKFS